MREKLTLGKKEKESKQVNKAEPKKQKEKKQKRPQKEAVKLMALPAKSKVTQQLMALDIGSKSIKAVIGQYRRGRVYVKDAFEFPAPASSDTFDQAQIRKDEISRNIMNAMRGRKISAQPVVCTLQTPEVVQKDIVVPKVKEKELESMLNYEISQHLPVDISTYAIQCKLLAEITGEHGKQAKMQYCAVPKATAKDYQDIVSSAKLKPIALDVNTNSLEKLLKADAALRKESPNGNIVFVDMGHRSFNIAFYSQGDYLFNRISNIGCHDIDEVIYRNMEASESEIEMVKLSQLGTISMSALYAAYGSVGESGGVDDAGEVILRETVGVIEHWAKMIQNVIEYYIAREGKYQVDQVLLYGGSSYFTDIDRFFEERLGIPTRQIGMMDCIQVSQNVAVDDISKYINAIGALIRV